MKRQTKPFTVEVKRTRRAGKPTSIWSDAALEAMQDKPDVEPSHAIAPRDRNRAVTAGETPGAPSSPSSAPRILQDTTPVRVPAEPEIVRPKRGRPPKLRTDPPTEAQHPVRAVKPAKKAKLRVAEPIATVVRDEPLAPSDALADHSTLDLSEVSAATQRAPRQSRRRMAGSIGDRWKRHLPRWKR